ncbi:FtsK/SpoIIIE family protein [Streptomyces sp. WMMB 714]|uniref:FHA domain-containing protein n=1 Tax=Streptomyces sp. WMMB 714 TaxID=1286822 RepID=UPI0005F79FBB|nr:FHA domain-containing protein [Streptomyces sp. WMMB 714]SCK56924.1 FtsK/SpoIIIE family protein [Streptomyces sp. WMMB 714]
MQIRLTVTLGPRGGGPGAGEAAAVPGAAPSCDVIVSAPSGTPLSAVTGALVTTAASAAGASGASGTQGAAPADSSPDSSAAVYVGTERLDPHRQMLGEPPLVDGAVVSLHGPAPVTTAPALAAYGSAKARLHVTAGPDAGGIHLLQGGRVQLGRAADVDVPLDDPDVSRLHCAITVSDGGAVTVTDLGSTNGTSLDGAPVGTQPVLFRPGSTLRIGESVLRLETSANGTQAQYGGQGPGSRAGGASPGPLRTVPDGAGQLRLVDGGPRSGGSGASGDEAAPPAAPSPAGTPDSSHGYARGDGPFPDAGGPDGGTTHGSGLAQHARYAEQFPPAGQTAQPAPGSAPAGPHPGVPAARSPERSRPRGLGAWARRFAGARPEDEAVRRSGPPGSGAAVPGAAAQVPWGDERCPDPATVLLTSLGPGLRLWEREPDHPDALTVRIGTAHHSGSDPDGLLTVGLRRAGSLGLAGPRPRLTGLARSVVAQLAALHGPSTLEIVLLSADRSREREERTAEWSWLGWLPHLRPVHGQDCRLLMAFDRDQAAARAAELVRRLDEEVQGAPAQGLAAGHRASPGRGASRHSGPYTLLVVDGDPGSAELRTSVARLAAEGPAAGIHLLCLAETPAATPSSPLSETVETACETSAAFRECGALALLSGAVATAVRVVHRQPGAQTTPRAPGALGTVGTVDAVSAAWAERFARALAPLREPEGTAVRTGTASRAAVTLPRSSRLLDELGLARATPAALLSRWAGSARPGPGHARLVFGAGPRGPLEAELNGARGHCLVTGPSGSGKTELLRSLAAALSAGERPDRLRLMLLEGDGAAREDLRSCLDLPHVRGHLAASDPVRMREFAQALSGELKRRAELIGPEGDYESFAGGPVRAVRSATPRQLSGQEEPGRGTERAGVDSADAGRGASRATAGAFAQSAAGAGREPAPHEPGGAPGADAGSAPATLRLRVPDGDVFGGPGSGAAPPSGPEGGAGAASGVPGPSGAAPSPDAPQTAGRPGGTRIEQPTVPPSVPQGRAAAHEAATGGDDASVVQHLETSTGSLPRLVVLVDDFDTLVDPALGNPGRPAAGSVVRALEAVARDGARLGVHLVAVSGSAERTVRTAVARSASLRVELSWAGGGGGAGEEKASPGRGALVHADGSVTAFQAGRVTGRIPRTSTQRPTVVPLEWARAGDPPARRPVRELGNGPTDLALLASAVGRAARSLGVDPQESDAPAANRSRSGQDEVLES